MEEYEEKIKIRTSQEVAERVLAALLRNSIREPNCLQLSNSYTMH